MQTFSVDQIQIMQGMIRQEGLFQQPMPAKEFRGYRFGPLGASSFCTGKFIELPQTQTDEALNRRSFSMTAEEGNDIQFETSDQLLVAVQAGKTVVLFRLYSGQ